MPCGVLLIIIFLSFQGENPTPTEKSEGLYGEAPGDNVNQSLALSAHSHNHQTPGLIKQPLVCISISIALVNFCLLFKQGLGGLKVMFFHAL